MDKIKAALGKLFENNVDDGGLDEIIEMIDIKIKSKAIENIDEMIKIKTDEMIIKLDEQNTVDLKEYKEALAKTISKYLELGLNEFVKENTPSFTSEIVVESSKKLISGLSAIFKEANISIPDSDIDIVKDLEENISTLKIRLNTQIDENVESTDQIFEYEKSVAFMAMTSSLAMTQREKAQKLIESLDCKDIESFKQKLTIILEEIKPDDNKTIIEGIDPTIAEPGKIKTPVVKPGNTKADKLLESK